MPLKLKKLTKTKNADNNETICADTNATSYAGKIENTAKTVRNPQRNRVIKNHNVRITTHVKCYI